MYRFLKTINSIFRFKNPFYNLFLEKSANSDITFIPQNLWTGNSDDGRKIIDGYLSFHNETSSFNLNTWKKNKSSKLWNEKLHSFQWIDDVKGLGTNKARIFLRKNILQWIEHHNKWDPQNWNLIILSKRICNLLGNISFFYETADEGFQNAFTKSLNKQAIHLLTSVEIKINNDDRIFIPKAIILSSLCFTNMRPKLRLGLKVLSEILTLEILDDGMHFSRSPSKHLSFLKNLIDIKNYLGLSGHSIPKALNEIIAKMGMILKFFKINNNELAIFNEFNFIDGHQLNAVIKRANTRLRIPSSLNQACFKRISDNKLIFVMDCGSPSKRKTHAGSLSFEFSHFGEKLVVNSGSPFVNDKKWIEAMRSTAAHSTVSIDDINSSDIFYQKDTNTRIAKVWSELLFDKNCYWINSAHSGYKDIFGIIHNRKIHIDSKKLTIRGQDYFSKPTKHYINLPKKMFLRFHIHPDIKLNVTTSKKKVFLQLKNNIAWEFICSEAKVKLKEGIYLGTKKTIRKNNHIIVSENLIPEKKIKWMFRLIK